MALGGGYPKGRVIEIYGPESSGKTTLALHAVAEVQKMGGSAAFVDAEHALDPVYAKNLGVNTDELLVCQPDSGEMALDVVDQLVRSAALDVVVVDSVAALVPRAELEGDMMDQQMGLQVRFHFSLLCSVFLCFALPIPTPTTDCWPDSAATLQCTSSRHQHQHIRLWQRALCPFPAYPFHFHPEPPH
jgi:hypothetical protein